MADKPTAPVGALRWRINAWVRYRDIVWYRTIAALKAEARQNFLGYVWFLLEPALTTAILYVAYVLILHSGGPARVAMLLLGTICWQWFESSVMQGMLGIRTKLHIMMHFSLPKYIFPLVGIFTNTWKFLCVFLVLLAVCAFCGYPPNIRFLYLPLVLAAQLTLIIGVALPLAIAVAYVNDVTTITSSIFRLLMFISGVFFTVVALPPNIAAVPLSGTALFYFYLNPMAGLIESYRVIVLGNQAPDGYKLIYAVLCGLLLGTVGVAWSIYVDGKILKRANG
jgi:ABC-type polysaccharide/polyol phosphate export permease